ncbi:MAG: hypothetical protein GC136_07060 [Alphaproteobacteria bacterium]|nr:hypothetical protein [Alphaproteobacteria bacterium]
MLKIIPLLLLLLASPAFAAGKENVQTSRAQQVTEYDADGDGYLQVEELQNSWLKKFKAADLDGNGVVTRDEKNAAVEKFESESTEIYGRNAKNRAQRVKKLYRVMDEDGNRDGETSWLEYKAIMLKRQELFDRNGDGKISPQEYRADEERIPGSYKARKVNE